MLGHFSNKWRVRLSGLPLGNCLDQEEYMVQNRMAAHDLTASFAAVFVSVALVGQFGASLEELEDQRVRLASHACDRERHSTRENIVRPLEIVVDKISR